MRRIKLKDYCERNSISYATAYRWVKNGKFPCNVTQTPSGTILVDDDSEDDAKMIIENEVNISDQGNAISLFLKKTIEFSKNNQSVEDFAAFILNNFKLKLNNAPEDSKDVPKYSRNKQSSEEVQKHFQKFLPKTPKPQPNMFVISPESIDEVVALSEKYGLESVKYDVNTDVNTNSNVVIGTNPSLGYVSSGNTTQVNISGMPFTSNTSTYDSSKLTLTNGTCSSCISGTSFLTSNNTSNNLFQPTEKELNLPTKMSAEEILKKIASIPSEDDSLEEGILEVTENVGEKRLTSRRGRKSFKNKE